MYGQLPLFRGSSDSSSDNRKNSLDPDRFLGSVLCSAVGDALGWPTEFLTIRSRANVGFELPLRDFVTWKKRVGGKWWGYTDTIKAGSYSDDTQLLLAVARSIDERGNFIPENFAYEELPLWLHYERGGGRSIKAASRSLLQRQRTWFNNFYQQRELNYRTAGANGAAMRNLPLALASVGNDRQIIRNSFYNAIVTHGHPRAILGAIAFGLAVNYVLQGGEKNHIAEYLRNSWTLLFDVMSEDRTIQEWIKRWDSKTSGSLLNYLLATIQEFENYLDAIPTTTTWEDYYERIGAFSPETKGSGIATVAAALFIFLRYYDDPHNGLFTSVNILGSDTDTISSFVGALFGAKYGIASVPEHLQEKIQDKGYLENIARKLYNLTRKEERTEKKASGEGRISQRDAYLRILAWEIGLHEMFWDALEEGSPVVHPTLGRGQITGKEVRPIRREGYMAKLISVSFDSGQSCIFHSRVQDNLRVAESLVDEIEKNFTE